MNKVLLGILLCILTLTGCYPIDSLSGVTIEDARLSTMSKDYFVGVAEGDIANHVGFNKIAFNATVGTAEEDIWFGSIGYVFPAVAQQMELVSTSVEDDPVKADLSIGTGVHSVMIYYLDNAYAQKTETVTLNGLGIVTTAAANILRVNDIRAWTVGSAYKAVGNISIRNIAGTPVYRYLPAGFTRGRCSSYTVPLGKALYIMDWYVGVSGLNAGNYARLTLKSTYNELGSDNINGIILTPGLFFMPLAGMAIPNSSITRNFVIPIKVPATCDVKVSAYSDSGAAVIETAYRGWIE